TGEPRMDDAPLYAEAMRRIQAEADPIVYPTYVPAPDPAARFAHVRALAEDPSVNLEAAPIDMGTNSMASFVSGEWIAEDATYENPGSHLRYFFATCRELKLAPAPVVRDPAQLRALLAYRAQGLASGPLL